MAIKLDARFLRDHGYGSLSRHQANILLKAIYETAERIVGMQLTEQMTTEQLDAFESFIHASDEAGALAWLERNFPAYRETVSDALSLIGAELRATASQVRADLDTPDQTE